IKPRATLHKQSYGVEVTGNCSLMQWSRMGMVAHRIVSIRILAGIQQQPNDLGMPELRSQRECAKPIVGARSCERATRILNASECRRDNQIDLSAIPKECLHRFELPMRKRRS